MSSRRRRVPAGVVGAVNLVGVLVLFFAMPVSTDRSVLGIVVGLVLTIGGVATVTWVLVHEVRDARTAFSMLHMVLMLEIVLVAFALFYYALEVHAPGQMAGLRTRIDALYYSAITMTTVGYGDVTPVSPVARSLVTFEALSGQLFIAITLARLVSGQLAKRGDAGD